MFRILVAFSFLTSLFVSANAQSVQEIVAHHIEALGGKEKLQGINSVYQEGTAVLASGGVLRLKIWQVYDRLYREELDLGVGKIVIVVTPRQGWLAAPATGGAFKSMPEAQVKALRMKLDPAGALADYAAKGNKIDLAGRDTVDGHPCYSVKVWFPSNESITYSIDPKTWYILRERRKGGGILGQGNSDLGWHGPPDGSIDIRFYDYRDTRGAYIFPFGMMIAGLGRVNINKVEVNGTVDAEALSKPK
jgi:hypothetical protein